MNKYFDCGTHEFEGFKKITDILKADKTWQCYCLEANSITYVKSKSILAKLVSSYNIEHYNVAVTDFNGYTNVNCAYKIKDGNDPSDLFSFTDDASNILSNPPREFGYVNMPFIVHAIDFAKFLTSRCVKEDYIAVKLDIEGCEFGVIDKLIETGTIEYINELFVEYHERFFDIPDFYAAKRKKYEEYFAEHNIKHTIWE